MQTTIPLNSLRTNPWHFINLIKQGTEVIITDRGRIVVRVIGVK